MSNELPRLTGGKTVLGLLLIFFAALSGNVAHATPTIMAANNAPACSTCHTKGLFTKAEGTAGLSAFLKSKTPTCTLPQVLQSGICVTPPPTCVLPQVLQGGVCVTPPPTCVLPQVLQGGVCVTPPPTCVLPQALQGGGCVTPPPTCVLPQVLQGGVCVTLPTTPPLTCTAPQILQNGSCVTPIANACSYAGEIDDDGHSGEHEGDDDHGEGHEGYDDGKALAVGVVPLLYAPDHVTVHAGEASTLAVTAFDCASRPLTIVPLNLPDGAAFENTVDPQLHMTKGVVTWTPTTLGGIETIEMDFKVVADDGSGQPVESNPQAVMVRVLPPSSVQASAQDEMVSNNTVISANYRAKARQLLVSGQLAWNNTAGKRDRARFAKSQRAIVSDAATGMQLGTAAIKRNGGWRAAIKIDPSSAPCAVDVEAGGVVATQTVKGVQCQ